MAYLPLFSLIEPSMTFYSAYGSPSQKLPFPPTLQLAIGV